MNYNIDPELSAALAAKPAYTEAPPPPPAGVSAVEHARQLWSVAFGQLGKYYAERLPEPSRYTVSDKRVPVEGGEITARIVTPSIRQEEALPVLVWYHGGGWMVGDLDMDDAHLRTIAVELKLIIVNVDYRMAPEHPFPTPFEDCYTALKWVTENAAELQVDLKKGFIVGGDSAGANISAAIAVKARDDSFFAAHPLTGQYLRELTIAYPGAFPEKYKDSIGSLDEFTDTPLLNKEKTLFYFKAYCSTPSDLRVSPVLAASHVGLPPAFLQVQELDPVRDDGILYDRILREKGVPTKMILYPGCLHAFHYAFPGISAAVKMDRDAKEGIKWLLNSCKSS